MWSPACPGRAPIGESSEHVAMHSCSLRSKLGAVTGAMDDATRERPPIGVPMDTNHFDTLMRRLIALDTWRGAVATVIGGAVGLLQSTSIEAGHHKHQHHRKRKHHGGGSAPPSPPPPPRPFCAGQNTCVSDALCSSNPGIACFCFASAGAGEPFCGLAATGPDVDCATGAADEPCVDVAECQAGTRCTRACPTPI